MASIVSGSVGEISAPKYSVSRNVKLLLRYDGIIFTQPYIMAPIRNADIVVPNMANVNIAPRLRKKYFCQNIKIHEKTRTHLINISPITFFKLYPA